MSVAKTQDTVQPESAVSLLHTSMQYGERHVPAIFGLGRYAEHRGAWRWRCTDPFTRGDAASWTNLGLSVAGRRHARRKVDEGDQRDRDVLNSRDGSQAAAAMGQSAK